MNILKVSTILAKTCYGKGIYSLQRHKKPQHGTKNLPSLIIFNFLLVESAESKAEFEINQLGNLKMST